MTWGGKYRYYLRYHSTPLFAESTMLNKIRKEYQMQRFYYALLSIENNELLLVNGEVKLQKI
jgi:hypothetical protein